MSTVGPARVGHNVVGVVEEEKHNLETTTKATSQDKTHNLQSRDEEAKDESDAEGRPIETDTTVIQFLNDLGEDHNDSFDGRKLQRRDTVVRVEDSVDDESKECEFVSVDLGPAKGLHYHTRHRSNDKN